MTKAGKDVTLLTRGQQLEAIRANGGLYLHFAPDDVTDLIPVKAVAEAEYDESPDVVIVTVKAYSLDSIYPVLDRVSRPDTVILPLINALDIGSEIAEGMESPAIVAQGEAYVACELVEPGKCKHKLDFFRIVLGPRRGSPMFEDAPSIQKDLVDCGCTAEINEDMLQAALMKFARVSALSGAMVYYRQPVGEIITDPDKTKFLVSLCQELIDIANTAGSGFPEDFDAIADLMDISRSIDPNYRTSLMYDFESDSRIESKTMFDDPYRLGRELGLPMESYGKVAALFKS